MRGECTPCRFTTERLLSPYALSLKKIIRIKVKGREGESSSRDEKSGRIKNRGDPKRKARNRKTRKEEAREDLEKRRSGII